MAGPQLWASRAARFRPALAAARAAALVAALALLAAPGAARAQSTGIHSPPSQPVSKTDPVFYQADTAVYDRDGGLVTLTGHVEIWQGDRDLRADTVRYDRNTGVAAAIGHVVMLDPSGQVVFSDYAELSGGLKDGVLTNMRAQLADNGHLAANGARRTGAQINELSRVIYSTCDACKDKPDGARLWDIRARSAVQDIADQRIEYRDAVLDIYGVPVAWFPYLTHPDPTAKRQSGLLVPAAGYSKYLGAFAAVPYYWVIDGATDVTLTPLITSNAGVALQGQLRRAFNNGTVTVNASLASFSGVSGDLFAKGQFAINDEWRWGFDLQRGSSLEYLRDFHIQGLANVLTSQVYLEGFGQGAWSKLDVRAYQGLSSNVVTSELPYVLPRYQYSFAGQRDPLGGRLSLDAEAFNVNRQIGTNTQRADLRLNWERPATGALGDLWKLVLHVDGAGYAAHQLDAQPSWGPENVSSTAQAMPTAALDMNWPFARTGGRWGNQVIEPIVQLVAAPNGSSYATVTRNGRTYVNSLIPNEDSLDFDFTDANLFSLNRFAGVDRLEGGLRANVALHGAWFFPDNEHVDAVIGQGYRTQADPAFPVGSGLEGTVTDVVSRLTYVPNPWFDINSQGRFGHSDFALHFADIVASGGPSWLRLNAGYLYSNTNPFYYYDTAPTGTLPNTPRDEVSGGLSTHYGSWRLSANARRDVQTGQMVSTSAGGAYENECFIFDVEYYHRFVSINGDNGASAVLFQLTFKTVGTIGFNAL